MQFARQISSGRSMAGPAPHAPPINRTSARFGEDAEQRRRRATSTLPQAPSPPRTTEFGSIGLADPSYAEIRRQAQLRRAAHVRVMLQRMVAALRAQWTRMSAPAPSGTADDIPASKAGVWQRPKLFGCAAVAGLALTMIGWPSFNSGMPLCRTEPAVLAPGVSLDVMMTVSHSAACSISSRAGNVPFEDIKVAIAPQHGQLALRGRTGVTYRPAREFTGEDFFAFALRARSNSGQDGSLVRVRVTVK